jgi:N-acetylglucosaminyl-diphospho-decaprenol L-rhamnosyltransferase
MQLSIVIVNYNTGNHLNNCLEAIYKTNGILDYGNIVVYDNNSHDKSLIRAKNNFPNVKYIGSHTNLGFASAVNKAVKNSDGEYILLLNPDVVVFPGVIDLMLRFMDNAPRCGILGGEILSPSGYRQPTCRRFPNYFNVVFGRRSLARRLFPDNSFSKRYLYLNLDSNEPQKVDFVEGSLMMIRRKALEDVAFFDEHFFLYLEDADICYRMRKKGWETWWLPRTYAIHYRGENFRKDNVRPAMHHSRGFYKFFIKHYRPVVFVRLLLKFLLNLRLAYIISLESIKKIFHDTNLSPRN